MKKLRKEKSQRTEVGFFNTKNYLT
ncbi:hypothetical protein ELI_0040 [Eubacterium callanderi]|uniref:Uncharacterized protein n=1 Tax=Eubacterium callanderi TaxID=53442 RepID=E3GHA7_9FIRM|nr:hypothetical protein ELI_0040 [Eubacterium callanderi]